MALPNDLPGRIADAKNFHNSASPSPADWGLTAQQLTDLKASYQGTEAAIDTQTAADSAKKKATVDKNTKAADFDKLYSQLRGVAQAHPGTTDAMRAQANLATGEGTAKDAAQFDVAPLQAVEQAGVHQHLLRFFMTGEKSNSTRLPDTADGAQLWMKIGGEPTTDLKDYVRIVFDTKSPYLYEHDAADAGKPAHYIARWATDDGEDFSPQSEVFTITIT